MPGSAAGYRMSFTNFGTGTAHAFGGTYVELTPHVRIRYMDRFDDPNLQGDMHVPVALRTVSCGTELTIVQEDILSVIPVAGCYLDWQVSLSQLAALVEPPSRTRRRQLGGSANAQRRPKFTSTGRFVRSAASSQRVGSSTTSVPIELVQDFVPRACVEARRHTGVGTGVALDGFNRPAGVCRIFGSRRRCRAEMPVRIPSGSVRSCPRIGQPRLLS